MLSTRHSCNFHRLDARHRTGPYKLPILCLDCIVEIRHTFCFLVLHLVHATATRALFAGRGRSASSTSSRGDFLVSKVAIVAGEGDMLDYLEGYERGGPGRSLSLQARL